MITVAESESDFRITSVFEGLHFTKSEHITEFIQVLTKDTWDLALTDKLWGVCWGDFRENWLCYNGSTLYHNMIYLTLHGSILYLISKHRSMASCKRDVTPLLTHWSYVSFAWSHRTTVNISPMPQTEDKAVFPMITSVKILRKKIPEIMP